MSTVNNYGVPSANRLLQLKGYDQVRFQTKRTHSTIHAHAHIPALAHTAVATHAGGASSHQLTNPQYETFEDRRIAFGNVEALAEKAVPFKPTPWQLRHDVIQRLETFALLEAERREKEQAALDKRVAAYEDNFVKKGGEALGLASNEEVRTGAVLRAELCVASCVCRVGLAGSYRWVQRDPEDPDFMNPGAHENKVEEMAEILCAPVTQTTHAR